MLSNNSSTEREYEKTLVISTGHMTLNDSRLLGAHDGEAPFVLLDYHEGFIVSLSEYDDERISLIRDFGLSEAFITVLGIAAADNCTHVKFDCDAPLYDDLEHFDW